MMASSAKQFAIWCLSFLLTPSKYDLTTCSRCAGVGENLGENAEDDDANIRSERVGS